MREYSGGNIHLRHYKIGLRALEISAAAALIITQNRSRINFGLLDADCVDYFVYHISTEKAENGRCI